MRPKLLSTVTTHEIRWPRSLARADLPSARPMGLCVSVLGSERRSLGFPYINILSQVSYDHGPKKRPPSVRYLLERMHSYRQVHAIHPIPPSLLAEGGRQAG